MRRKAILSTIRPKLIICLFLLVATSTDCSTTRMAANQTAALLVQAMPAYDRETNVEFAEQSIVGNLKLLEGLLEVTPENSELLILTSSSYARYAFGFMEEKIDIANRHKNLDERKKLVAQAVDFYDRARKYSLRALSQIQSRFPEAVEQDLERLSSELAHFDKKDVPALFWFAFAWGSSINLRQDDPEQVSNLSKVDVIMQRVIDLDEEYFHGGPHLFYGVYYGSRPAMLGGDPEKAKQHLLRAIEINDGKYLTAQFLLARYYAVSVQDRELFRQTLGEIISAPADLMPEQGLANQLAKRNAERWLSRIDELFF